MSETDNAPESKLGSYNATRTEFIPSSNLNVNRGFRSSLFLKGLRSSLHSI
ncbi:hypothetical protein [Methanosarcina sp.]|uniref:hypothetical protein n=1 Tax=Methanosarcina sp. TaxID=2213 RepID=UPI00298936BA|nr:hypothetical protein [Methanosarcina sp.]MDW5551121.1 hypothetical protein [Methanosarcina sp.]MDW5552848.1 hypothetical protein [Methanosarcina sp.]MDW5558137.1 hypothetical protein [Methanosarcina sp.]